jgi:hypothetical protein
MSVTCGLLLVFALPGAKTLSTSKHTISPAIDITLGVLILGLVFAIATGRDRRRQAWSERRREKKKDKPPPRWKRTLSKGSPRDTFVIGILLSFPGASYIAGMDLLSKQNIGTTATVVAVLAFNVIMLLLLELPLGRVSDQARIDRGHGETLQRLAHPSRRPSRARRSSLDRNVADGPWRPHSRKLTSVFKLALDPIEINGGHRRPRLLTASYGAAQIGDH